MKICHKSTCYKIDENHGNQSKINEHRSKNQNHLLNINESPWTSISNQWTWIKTIIENHWNSNTKLLIDGNDCRRINDIYIYVVTAKHNACIWVFARCSSAVGRSLFSLGLERPWQHHDDSQRFLRFCSFAYFFGSLRPFWPWSPFLVWPDSGRVLEQTFFPAPSRTGDPSLELQTKN